MHCNGRQLQPHSERGQVLVLEAKAAPAAFISTPKASDNTVVKIRAALLRRRDTSAPFI
jgi:hypothetical protein